MKIWLNHTLECLDDRTYPLHLSIFLWETKEEEMEKLLKAYKARKLLNFRDQEKPLEIYESTLSESEDISQENIKKIREDFAIIHTLQEKNLYFFYDTCVIRPQPLEKYLLYYINFLREFSEIVDRSDYLITKDIFSLISRQILPKIEGNYSAFKKDRVNNSEKVLDLLSGILQELLFLNIFLTYCEIEEGLLMCTECKWWFPIIKTIPRIYPKSMNREEMDLNFLKKWRDKFPEDVFIE